MSTHSTRSRLLSSAERLFAQSGYHSCTLREVTADAGANLAAVNYHFGSKEGLLRSLVLDRGKRANQERTRRLAEAVDTAKPDVPELRQIMAAFIEPILAMRAEYPYFPALMARIHVENLMPIVGEIFESTFYQTLKEFTRALSLALPELPTDLLKRRLLFTVGAFNLVLLKVDEGTPFDFDVHSLASELTSYCTAGVSAPVSDKTANSVEFASLPVNRNSTDEERESDE